ncbi:hypothetical protein [Micromonospora sp. CPCC 206061]|uniref:hypothetical protein n=1 Tax=Micromonospora sp. CPCC 206061 TaxID=3122410 RepID=UPI002FF14F86
MTKPGDDPPDRLRVGGWLSGSPAGNGPASVGDAPAAGGRHAAEGADTADRADESDEADRTDRAVTAYAAPALPDDDGPASGPAHRVRRRRTPLAVIAGGAVAVALAVTVSIITLDDPPAGEGVALGTPSVSPVQVTADSGLGSGPTGGAPTTGPPGSPSPTTPSVSPTNTSSGPGGSVTTSVEAEDALLVGTAEVLAEPAASGGRLVHQIGTDQAGNAGQLVFNEVTVARATRYALTVAYVSGEDRNVLLAVNGQRPLLLRFPSSGGWNTVATQTFTIELRAGRNRLAFSNPTYFAPRIDKINLLG